jgi:galactose mutarotase-like enzyme
MSSELPEQINDLRQQYEIYGIMPEPGRNGFWLKGGAGNSVMVKGTNLASLQLQGRQILLPGAMPRAGLTFDGDAASIVPPDWYRTSHFALGTSNSDAVYHKDTALLTPGEAVRVRAAQEVAREIREGIASETGGEDIVDLMKIDLAHHGVTQLMAGFQYNWNNLDGGSGIVTAGKLIRNDRHEARPHIPFSMEAFFAFYFDELGRFHHTTTLTNLEPFTIPVEFMAHPYYAIPGGIAGFNKSLAIKISGEGRQQTRTVAYDLIDYYSDNAGQQHGHELSVDLPLVANGEWLELIMPDGTLRLSYEGDYQHGKSTLGIFAPDNGFEADLLEKQSHFRQLWLESSRVLKQARYKGNTFPIESSSNIRTLRTNLQRQLAEQAYICLEPKSGTGGTLRTREGLETALWLKPQQQVNFSSIMEWLPS